MKKSRYCITAVLLLLFAVLALGGCDSSILKEVPRTAAVSGKQDSSGKQERSREQESGRQQENINTTDEPEASEAYKEEPFCFTMESASSFTYDRLSEAEQIWYKDMERLIGSMEEKGKLSEQGITAGLDETSIDRIFQCMLNDHPEFFYVDGYTYTKYTMGDTLLSIEFSGNYSMDLDTAKQRKAMIEEAVEPVISGISAEAGDYDKVKYVYETIILNTDYNLDASDNQNIYSVFVNKSSVCQGYAKATQYLLNRLGVECTMVQGSVDTGEGHAWNLVSVDGSFYYVDTTWGDAYYNRESESLPKEGYPEINYDYLCITTKDLMRTHILNTYVPMPECVDTKDNYYVREGALFTAYDKEQMKQLFDNAKLNNKTFVTVKCADEASFQEIMGALITDYEIFEYLDREDKEVSYSHDEKWLSLTFWVTNE